MRWRIFVLRFVGAALVCSGVLFATMFFAIPLGNNPKGTLSPLGIVVLRCATVAIAICMPAMAIPAFRMASRPRPPRVAVDFKNRHVRFEHVWVEQPWPAIFGSCETIDCSFADIVAAELIDGPHLAVLTARGKITIPNWLENFDLLVACMLQVAEQRRMPLVASRRLHLAVGLLAISIAGGLVWAGIQLGWF